MESELKVSAWAEVVISDYSLLSREQTMEIWHEFNVWATTRVIGKAQAKRKGFGPVTVKTLVLHGKASNLQEAYCKAMQFIRDRSAKYFLHIFGGMLPGAATKIVADCLAGPLKP